VESAVVDKINILAATREAMANAICGLKEMPSFLLCDAISLPGVEIPQRGIIKGDCQSVSIAAASILAKVARDRLVLQLAKEYPGYELEKNKGYGTARHLRALRQLGPTPLHRLSFRGVVDFGPELPFED
jgi:ribonuclease HII